MKTGKSDVIWSYVAQFIRYGNALILLPFVLRYLPSEELAFWYLFSTISGFVLLADFGFSNTIIRNIAYVFSGAKLLLKEGIPETEIVPEESIIDNNLLTNTILSSKFIYKRLAILVSFVLIILGSLYINWTIINKSIENKNYIWISWYIYGISTILNFYFSYLNSLLIGRGFVKQAQQASIVTTIVYLVTSFVGLKLGYGIIAMALGYLLSTIINRILSHCFFYDNFIKSIMKSSIITLEEKKETIKIIWFNAKKTGVVILGSFLLTRVGQFFVTSFFPLQIAAQYGLTIQVLSVTAGLAGIYFNAFVPKTTSNFYQNNKEYVIKNMGVSLVFVFCTFSFVLVFYILLGNWALSLIHSKTLFLAAGPSALLFLVYFLETQHSIMASVHAYQNRIPFAKPAILSGLSVTILTFIVLKYLGSNIWFLIIVPFIVSLSYQNWKWPYDACKYFKIGFFEFYKIGFVEIIRIAKRILIKK